MSIINNNYPTTSTNFTDNIRGSSGYNNKTRSQNLYDKINTSKRNQTGLRFPSDLGREGSDNVIRFNVNVPSGSKYIGGEAGKVVRDSNGNLVSSERRGAGESGISARLSGNVVRTDTVIDLFLPPNIQTNYSSNWNADGTGITGEASDAIFNIANSGQQSGTPGVLNSASDAASGLDSLAIRSATNLADKLVGSNLGSSRSAATSTIRNPYMEVVFEGINPRTFSFTFKMIPRNAGEQDTIHNIVKQFKFHSAPEVKYEGTSAYWLFPAEFDITFLHNGTENQWVHKVSTCALTSVDVNYSAEGQYAAHSDGSPFSTTLTLEFQEMILLTKEKILEGY